MINTLLLLMAAITIRASLPLPGHLQPLGHHRPSDGHITILDDMITPKQFWLEFCQPGKPVLFKNFATKWPAYSRWTDEYLRKKYGHLRVKIESKYEKNDSPIGDHGVGQDSIRHFIDSYITDDKYMVSQIPDVMTTEVLAPPCVLCGSFRRRLLEANIWMSSGNTSSLLHRDADNAINCLLHGTKQWVMIDPVRYTQHLPVEVEFGDPYGGFTLLNVDSVDLVKYPDVTHVRWQFANMNPGDCIFLPKGYWHQVRSYGNRNMAVSLLMSRLNEFDDIGCLGDVVPSVEVLWDVGLVWTYDGVGVQGMGNPDPFELNETVAEWCDESDNRMLDYTKLREILFVSKEVKTYEGTLEVASSLPDFTDNEVRVIEDRSRELLATLDEDQDGVFDCNCESQFLTVAKLKVLGEQYDPDPGNTDQFEYWLVDSRKLKEIITSKDSWQLDEFLAMYTTDVEGSHKGGMEIFEMLDEDEDGVITSDEINQGLNKVLQLFDRHMLSEFISRKPEHQAYHKTEL